MIVNIAGTSGAGKTTLVRALLARGSRHELVTADWHPKPVGIIVELPGASAEVFVAGRYEEGLQTCGCDTIKDVSRIYGLVEAQAALGFHVVYEGLFVMNHTRGPEMVHAAKRNGWGITVVRLTTLLDVCKASVNDRRAVQGKGPLADWKNTVTNDVRARNFADKMQRAGATVHRVPREAAMEKVMEALRS